MTICLALVAIVVVTAAAVAVILALDFHTVVIPIFEHCDNMMEVNMPVMVVAAAAAIIVPNLTMNTKLHFAWAESFARR